MRPDRPAVPARSGRPGPRRVARLTSVALALAVVTSVAVAPQASAVGNGSLVPVLNCIVVSPDGSYRAVFGYRYSGSKTVTVPRSLANFMLPADMNGLQPTSFRPGTHDGAFATPPQSRNRWVTWVLFGQSATATPWSTKCGPDVTLPTEGNGMGPVIVLVVSTALSIAAAGIHRRRRTRKQAV